MFVWNALYGFVWVKETPTPPDDRRKSRKSKKTLVKPFPAPLSAYGYDDEALVLVVSGNMRRNLRRCLGSDDSYIDLIAKLALRRATGRHCRRPCLDVAYHEHVLDGDGGVAFTYIKDAETGNHVPVVYDFATERGGCSGNEYHWRRHGETLRGPPPVPDFDECDLRKLSRQL